MPVMIITGATSGLGEALARHAISRGYTVLLTGRRIERLQVLKEEFGDAARIGQLDVTEPEKAWSIIEQLIQEVGGVDVAVLNSGVSNFQGEFSPETEQWVIDVNVSGFMQTANRFFSYFEERGSGQLVGISSVAGMFGYRASTAYCASKAFVSNYLQGLRQRARWSKASITVTDIRPGFVESEMTEGKKGMFWLVPADYAAVRMLEAIEAKKTRAFVPRRWALIGLLITVTPNRLLDRL